MNIRNRRGHTGLHIASYNGKKEISEILIEGGAEINVKDNKGNTALHMAS